MMRRHYFTDENEFNNKRNENVECVVVACNIHISIQISNDHRQHTICTQSRRIVLQSISNDIGSVKHVHHKHIRSINSRALIQK